MPPQENPKPIALDAYESLAESYAARVDTKPENAYYERPATLSLLPDVKGLHVLDAGCGPGVYTEWLVDHGASVVALDVSPSMVRLARKRVGRRAQILQADLNQPLSFAEDGVFDVVLSPLVLDYLEDWHGVLSEFSRVLKEAGILIISVEHPMVDHSRWGAKNYFSVELLESVWSALGDPVIVRFFRRPLQAIIDPLANSGFVVERLVEPRPTEAFEAADPETYEKLSRQPGFLSIRARKRPITF
jgi:SAM-dependent methyltransferase